MLMKKNRFGIRCWKKEKFFVLVVLGMILMFIGCGLVLVMWVRVGSMVLVSIGLLWVIG